MSTDKDDPGATGTANRPAASEALTKAATAPAAPGQTAGEGIEERTFRERRAKEAGKRLFIGARLSVAAQNALAAATETLARRARDTGVDVKWVAPVNYHVTLKFLGWTREAAVAAVRDALDQATRGVSRLTYRTTRLGAFPSLGKATVLWAGVDDAGGQALTQLATTIEAAMERLGFPRERRAFHPHVTIARLRESRPLEGLVLPMAEQMFGDTRLDAVTLFESETKSSGSVYTELAKIALDRPEIATPGTAERQTRAVELEAREDTDDGWPRGHHQT